MEKPLISWLFVILWMLVIFYFSSLPSVGPRFPVEFVDTLMRKFAHVGEYAILMLLAVNAFRHTYPWASLQQVLQLAFVFSLLYAVSDEWHQLFVQGREGTFRDVVIDCIGITLAGLFLQNQQKKGR